MKYYKVIQKFDNMDYWKKRKGKTALYFGGFLIGGELFTEKEIARFAEVRFRNRLRIEQMVEPIEVSRKKVYWSFGARFIDNEVLQEGQYYKILPHLRETIYVLDNTSDTKRR